MDDQNNVNTNTQNGDGNDTVVIDESLDSEAKLLALEEQNKKLYARAKKAEGFTQDSEGNWVKKTQTTQNRTNINSDRESTKPSDILKADEFKLYREGYSESEIDIIMANGGYKVIQDDKHPLTLGLKIAKEQRQAEDASSKANSSSGLTEIERKYTEQDMRNMKPEDLAKIIGFAQ